MNHARGHRTQPAFEGPGGPGRTMSRRLGKLLPRPAESRCTRGPEVPPFKWPEPSRLNAQGPAPAVPRGSPESSGGDTSYCRQPEWFGPSARFAPASRSPFPCLQEPHAAAEPNRFPFQPLRDLHPQEHRRVLSRSEGQGPAFLLFLLSSAYTATGSGALKSGWEQAETRWAIKSPQSDLAERNRFQIAVEKNICSGRQLRKREIGGNPGCCTPWNGRTEPVVPDWDRAPVRGTLQNGWPSSSGRPSVAPSCGQQSSIGRASHRGAPTHRRGDRPERADGGNSSNRSGSASQPQCP